MATNTYVAIASQTLSSAVPTVTFNSFSGYTDLILIISEVTVSTGTTNIIFRVNSDSASNYSRTTFGTRSNSGTPFSSRAANQGYGNINDYTASTTSYPTMAEVHFQDYANTTTHKTILSKEMVVEGDGTYSGVEFIASKWRSTNAITSIVLSCFNGANFNIGSKFSLYGVKAWSDETSLKATGGFVYSDSSYYYHAFPYSGTFTPNQSITADILAIAGGGGGGANVGGGGGAGGIIGFASQSLTATSYTVTVGAGSTAIPENNVRGGNGSNSQFGALTAAVGGGGGGSLGTVQRNGASGGSGGGGATGYDLGTGGTGGTGTSGQGNAGGNGVSGSNGQYLASGGGGGAGAAGTAGSGSGSTGIGGDGGIGVNTLASIGSLASWTSATGFGVNGYFAGGGGGNSGQATDYASNGRGGLGGGGAGGTYQSLDGQAGVAHTGGGGGSGGNGTTAGYGGSGLIIVRYAK